MDGAVASTAVVRSTAPRATARACWSGSGFGGPADQLLFEQAMQDMAADDDLGEQARANPIDQFRFAFDPKAMDALVSRVERNGEVAGLLLTNAEACGVALEMMMLDVYQRLRQAVPVAEGETK